MSNTPRKETNFFPQIDPMTGYYGIGFHAGRLSEKKTVAALPLVTQGRERARVGLTRDQAQEIADDLQVQLSTR